MDVFRHSKKERTSVCFRITYRHMEKTLTQVEVNELHRQIAEASVRRFNVEIR